MHLPLSNGIAIVFISTADPIRNQKERFESLKINFTASTFFSLLKFLSIPFDFLGESDYFFNNV